MASSTLAEFESLKRQHTSLTFKLARITREHELELSARDKLRASIVLKRDTRYKKTDALLAAMRSELVDLKRSFERATAQLEAKKHEVYGLEQEVATLCGQSDAATLRMKKLEKALKKQGSGPLRRRIKALCLKYHTDHRGVVSVSNDEVTRDLVELLAV